MNTGVFDSLPGKITTARSPTAPRVRRGLFQRLRAAWTARFGKKPPRNEDEDEDDDDTDYQLYCW